MQLRRKPYFFIFGLLGFAAWSLQAFVATNLAEAMAFLFLASLSLAFVNVLAEALIVERGGEVRGDVEGTKEKIVWMLTIYWGMESLVKVTSGVSGGYLLETIRYEL